MALSVASDGAAIQAHEFAYRRSADQDSATPAHHPVVVVGAGPVGLTLAIDLAQRGQRVLLLDNDYRLSSGSRAICFAKRTLEIWDRLGVGDAMCAKGVQWHVGRVYFREREVYRFDLLPDTGHERPAFINLQQFYAEAYLALRAAELPEGIELRWKNNVVGCSNGAGGVRLEVDTPDGRYKIDADYVIACDGSRSPLRGMLGLETQGRVFRDRFLIADITMDAPAESESHCCGLGELKRRTMSPTDVTSEALQGYRAAPGSSCPHALGLRTADAWIIGRWLRSNGRAAPISVVTSCFKNALLVDETLRFFVAPDGGVWHC